MEDDWIFLGDGGACGGSDTDSASDDGSDSGFTIVRQRGHKRGDAAGYSAVVISDDAPAPPRVAAVAVPQPMPTGLSFKVMSYSEAFSASASSSSEDGGPECNDDEATTAGEAIVSDDAAGTGSTDDDCAVTCKEGCESDQVGEHGGTGSSMEAPSVAVAATPTVNCPETTTAPTVLHGEAQSELASGMDLDQGGADEVEDDDDSSESSYEEEDDDDDTENSSGEEEDDDEEDTDSSSSDEDTDSNSSDEDTDSSSSDEDTDSSSEDEDEDTYSSSDEDYTESVSEEEYTEEICSEEEEDDDAESSGEEDDSEVSGEEQEQEEDDDDAECSGEVDDVESSGDESDDPESSGADSDDDAESYGEEEEEEEEEEQGTENSYEEEEKKEEDTVRSGEEKNESSHVHVVDVAENGKKDILAMLFPRATTTTACDANAEQAAANANGAVKEPSESFPSKYDDDMDTADSSGSDMDTNSSGSGSDMDTNSSGSGSDMDTDSSGSGSDMDTDSSDMDDDICSEFDEEDDTADISENGIDQAIFAMLFPKAKACGANVEDYEHQSEHGYVDYEGKEEEEEDVDGSLFDMLLPRDRAIHDDNDTTDSSDMEENCLESDEEDDIIVNVAEHGNQYILDMLSLRRAVACYANIDDYEDGRKHGSIDYEEEEEDGSLFDIPLTRDCAIDDDIDSSHGHGEHEAATATAACGYSAETSHGTRRPEVAGRAARGYDDIDTDSESDMEGGDDAAAVLQRRGFASHSQSQAERQALLEDLRRQLAAEALEESSSSGQQQQRRYDDVDDTCDLPGTAAALGSCACARTAEAQFTARAVRDGERELAMEEARRREAAQRELDRALAREAAAAAQALESALVGCAPVKRPATGVARPAVAEPAAAAPADISITFIIGIYMLVYLVVSLLSFGL